MATIGLIWFFYLIFHMFSNLSFYFGKDSFNNFYTNYNDLYIIRFTLLFLLILGLIIHFLVGVSREIKNYKLTFNHSYYKKKPKHFPRYLVYINLFVILTFIIFHIFHMFNIERNNYYKAMVDIFSSPIISVIYYIGIVSLFFHLFHSLTNVRQTLGMTHLQNKAIVFIIVLLLILGFLSIPTTIIL